MKFSKTFLITIILLAALSISAVSAENVTADNSADIETGDVTGDVSNVEDVTIPVEDQTGSDTTPVEDATNNDTEENVGDTNTTDNVTDTNITENGTDTNITEDINGTIISDDLIKYYLGDNQYHAILFDLDGNPLANTNVTVTINGQDYVRVTDENGTLTFNINLRPGDYTITVKNPVTNETVTNNITVLSTISGENIIKIFRNGTQYYATFLDSNGRPLANTNVTFNINGVFYTRQTNENGTARLNINLLPGEYILTATNPVNNQTYSNNVTVLSSISGENVIKYFRNGTQYYATFLDENGNPLANTNITFNINGVMYTRQTNENGTARLNINLNSGTYIITATNPINNQTYSNNITVLGLINGSDFTTTFQTNGSYSVKVVDENGNPVVNETVTFNINGVFYNRVTDENGTARLNINLLPGEYIITASYGGYSHSNKITVNKRQPSISLVSSTVPQDESIQVRVTYNGQPVEGIQILFLFSFYQGQAFGQTTDTNGIASIPLQNNYFQVNPGTYTITTGTQGNTYYQNVLIRTQFTVTY